MFADMEDKYLYPSQFAQPIIETKEYAEYMLSQVLASHGCMILKVWTYTFAGGSFLAVRYGKCNGDVMEEIGTIHKIPFNCALPCSDNELFSDLQLRYKVDDSGLCSPECIGAFWFGDRRYSGNMYKLYPDGTRTEFK